MRKNIIFSNKYFLTIVTVTTIIISTFSFAAKKKVTDAIVDLEFVADFTPLNNKHATHVMIDRQHKTIYKTDTDDHGAHAMLNIMKRDGYSLSYINKELNKSNITGDILIIHGLPNDKIMLDSGAIYWKSPLTEKELDTIVNWVSNGGGLFLTLSHHPGGSGARPLLEAFDVKFRDGYLFSKEFPSFVSPDGHCSHFFGMSANNGILNTRHPIFSMGESINKVDFHCGAAVFKEISDAVLSFPKGSKNYSANDIINETSDYYAGMIGFTYGKGKVVVATDQGLFRNFIFTFDEKEKVYVTISSPNNDNAKLFVNLMRWLQPKK